MANLCPCGSGEYYENCCGPIIKGEIAAPTAERLMRSRYTAFTLADGEYLMKSWHPRTRDLNEKESIRKWAKSVKWIGLQIRGKQAGGENDLTGIVSFRARFLEKGKINQIIEESVFEKIDGNWVYVTGKHD
ncbi:MAG: YchJ family protein [Bacteroidales bacterium]